MGVIIGSQGEGAPIVVPFNHPGAVLQRQEAEKRRLEREAKKSPSALPAEPLVPTQSTT